MSFLFNQLRSRLKTQSKILLLVDYRGWAYDHSAQELSRELANDFDFEIRYVHDYPKPNLIASRYDLIYVFFWGETYHQQFGFSPAQTIKSVSSHRWEDDPRFGPCTADEMVSKYLKDAQTVICTSERLVNIVSLYHPRTFHTPNGINVSKFNLNNKLVGPIKFGWAGNSDDPVKGLEDVLRPACEGHFELTLASGGLNHSQMNDFYNQIDVLAVSSRHEGEPLTLIEAMAAGCFPVCTNVGIVPELIDHQINGFIVNDRNPDAFRKAFSWCEANRAHIRKAGQENAIRIRQQRSWKVTAQYFKNVFEDTLAHANEQLN